MLLCKVGPQNDKQTFEVRDMLDKRDLDLKTKIQTY